MLTQYGCKVRWHRDGCALRHGKLGEVQVTVRDNCPYVFSDVGLKLAQELEAAEMEKKKALRNLELNNNDNKKEMVVTLDRLVGQDLSRGSKRGVSNNVHHKGLRHHKAPLEQTPAQAFCQS